jgi:hypothetical protein
MTIKINGTNTTAQPSITGTDTDTGLVYGTDEVKIVTGGVEKLKATNTGFDLKLDASSDSINIENTAGDKLYFAPGMGLDDWSRQILSIDRKSYQATPTDIRGTDVRLFSVNAAGTMYGYRSLIIGKWETDENVPVSTYNPDNNIGYTIYQGTTDKTAYRARLNLRLATSDDDDLACFYYVDSNSATTAVDYDQHQTLKMNGSGRIWAKYPVYSGRVESDEGSPNSVYVGNTSNGFYSYYGSGYSTYIRSRNTDNTDAIFYADTGGGVVIKFQSDGNGRFDGGADIGAASDYAEFFEWNDANPSNEDRRGLSVVLSTDGKIREATASDATSDIIGIVSANPAVVGDSAYLNWQGRHLKDEWGSWVTVEEEFLVWNKQGTETNEEGVKVPVAQPDITDPQCEPDAQVLVSEIAQHPEIPQYAIDNDLRITRKSRVTNPDFDPNVNYTPRVDRPEWDAIGLMGKLWLKPGQITGDRWLKLKDGNNGLTYWLVR